MVKWLKVGRIIGKGPSISDDTLTIPVTDYSRSYDYNGAVIVANIQGLGPVDADVNSTSIADTDGAWFNLARCDTRNIVITMKLGDTCNGLTNMMSKNRMLIYKYFPVKKPIRLWVNTDDKYVYIDGYVESVNADYFGNSEGIEVSILCPDPYFYNALSMEPKIFNFGNYGNPAYMFDEESGFPVTIGENGEVYAQDFKCGFDNSMNGQIKMAVNTDVDCPMIIKFTNTSDISSDIDIVLTIYDIVNGLLTERSKLIIDGILGKDIVPTAHGYMFNKRGGTITIDTLKKSIKGTSLYGTFELFGALSNQYVGNEESIVDNSRFMFTDWLSVSNMFDTIVNVYAADSSGNGSFVPFSNEFNAMEITIEPYIRYGGI